MINVFYDASDSFNEYDPEAMANPLWKFSLSNGDIVHWRGDYFRIRRENSLDTIGLALIDYPQNVVQRELKEPLLHANSIVYAVIT